MNTAQGMRGVANAAYRLASGGRLVTATAWQASLYEKLSEPESDVGILLLTPSGAGKTEGVIIPALGTRRGGAPRRVFLIAAEGSPLDEYVARLVPYMKAFVQGDGVARTLCVDVSEEDTRTNMCRRFYADGTEDPSIETNPLEADVDLVLTTLGRFRSLFFGSGGIHALPSGLIDADNAPVRRDLFFFDEAQEYDSEGFGQFRRLVEYLFAQDTDIVVASSTLPLACQEEFEFLETLSVPHTEGPGKSTLTHLPGADVLGAMEAYIRQAYYQNSRVVGVTEGPKEARTLYECLAGAYPHSVYVYHEGQEAEARRRTYAQLCELELEGEGYLLLTTGKTWEVSDLDATMLVSSVCAPESLIRRAGRCNRRGDLAEGQMALAGDNLANGVRALSVVQELEYLEAIRACQSTPFDAGYWKVFI